MAGSGALAEPLATAVARCTNLTALNAQLCADVWRNIPEGSAIGAGMWEALKLWWLTAGGGQPDAAWEAVVLNWPEDQLRMLRSTMVQYTSSEGGNGRVARIAHVNTVDANEFDEDERWKLRLTTRHTDEEVLVEFFVPQNPDGTIDW